MAINELKAVQGRKESNFGTTLKTRTCQRYATERVNWQCLIQIILKITKAQKKVIQVNQVQDKVERITKLFLILHICPLVDNISFQVIH